MWLVYLRFEGAGRTKVGHVRAANKQEAEQLVERARHRGASFPDSTLMEYGFFYSRGTIHFKVPPTSPEPVFTGESREAGEDGK